MAQLHFRNFFPLNHSKQFAATHRSGATIDDFAKSLSMAEDLVTGLDYVHINPVKHGLPPFRSDVACGEIKYGV